MNETVHERLRRAAEQGDLEGVEAALEAREKERQRFFELADRLASSGDPERSLKEELARMTFGE